MPIDKLLNRLPSHFNKEPESNNYKAFQLIARQIEDSEDLYASIQRFWDVDQAEGVGLDRLGKEEGLSRGGYDEETYRKLIKIQFIVNMSEGDLDSINTIFQAYMGDAFLGIEEGWDIHDEPASLFINIKPSNIKFPKELAQRIKATGVRLQVVLELYGGIIRLIDDTYSYPVFYKLCGQFWGRKEFSQIDAKQLSAIDDAYSYPVNYPITKKGTTLTESVPLEVLDDTYGYVKEYRECGKMMPLHKEVTTLEAKNTVTDDGYSFKKNYRLCGQFSCEG